MEAKLITVTEYCQFSNVEVEFINLLLLEDLIEVQEVSGEQVIDVDQLPILEQYARWYYDMAINAEGIDALRHMLVRLKKLQDAVDELETKLRLYE